MRAFHGLRAAPLLEPGHPFVFIARGVAPRGRPQPDSLDRTA
jgi:hypothetical protein